MIYLVLSSRQSPQWVGGLWGPAPRSQEAVFHKSCPYLEVPHHVCVPNRGFPQQIPRGFCGV